MRKVLLSIVLATSVAVPAAAQTAESGDRAERAAERRAERAEARAQRAQAREQRVERIERRAEPREREVRERVARERPARMEERLSEIEERRAQVRERIRARASDEGAPRPRSNVNERGRPTLGSTGGSAEGTGNWRERESNPRTSGFDRWINRPERRVTPPTGARPDRPAPPPETVSRRDRDPEWRRDWRRDRRYDWRRWRDRDRSRFHIGFYFDPFGWNYRRYGIGWRLWPSYYSNRYWLHDPWSYRLPYAPWPYKWVRYWDDAMLVNTRTGEVVDVIYDFFW